MIPPDRQVVGIPREVKRGERRVALTPDGAAELVGHGVIVLVETDAGAGAGIPDGDYRAAGADVVRADAIWERATLVCKVKEPQPEEIEQLRPDVVLFAYLHLAAYRSVADGLLERKVTGIAFETVQLDSGALPLLTPMSEIAGRMAPQVAARFLEHPQGGRGVLLGGAPGVRPGRVVILGAGHVGSQAVRVAVGMGAEIVVISRGPEQLRALDHAFRGRVVTISSTRGAIGREIVEADVLVGAVLDPGARAPTLVTEQMVTTMRPGSVIVDVSVDQGGCVETTHETTHDDPVYERHSVIHYAVGNMPGAVPRTSTYALTNATLPYVVALATHGLAGAVGADRALGRGVNTFRGQVTNPAVAAALDVHPADLAALV